MYRALISLILTSIIGSASLAAKLDIHTHDLVIQKLESVLESIEGQKSEISIYERLADLYADRARLKAIQESEKNCEDCLAAKSDREKAIQAYLKAVSLSEGQLEARWTLQVAHLYKLNGQPEKSQDVLLAVIQSKNKRSPELMGESHAALGEIFYQKGQFAEAKKHFESALSYTIANPYIVKYRLSWCYFNEGELSAARNLLFTVLNDKRLTDSSLRKDFSRDMVTFIARENIDEAAIQSLMSVTPEDQKKNNMFYLGQECDRLGNKKGSLLVWALYAKMGEVNKDEHLEMTIRTAQTLLDQNKLSESLAVYQRFFKQFNIDKCESKELCAELQAKSRQYVYSWIKKEKTEPHVELVKALEIYSKNNPNDVEMLNWSGHIARHLKKNVQAAQSYHYAAEQSYKLLNSRWAAKTNLDRSQIEKIFEGALLAEIECAEESNSKDKMEQAYKHYLELNPDGDKVTEVRYQMAHLKYSKNNFKDAANEFMKLVRSPKGLSSDLRVKAADLTLECLENTKDFNQLAKVALEWAQIIPEKKMAYLGVARKSIVNQAVALMVAGEKSNPKTAYALIEKAPLEGATQDEKVKIFKIKIQMAEKLLDLSKVQIASRQLLAIAGLSADDRQYASNKLLWVAESQLDFNEALKIVQKYTDPKQDVAERLLKVAVLTELSGLDSTMAYEKYLRRSNNVSKANIVRSKLIRESVNPWYAFKKFKKELKKSPDIYVATLIDVYAQAKNNHEMQAHINEKQFRNSLALAPIRRMAVIVEVQKLDREIGQLSMNSNTNSRLKRSLDQRLKHFAKLNDFVRKAARQGDFTVQLIASNALVRENKRLANEIQKLPVPKNLNQGQAAEYSKLLQAQAQPFSQRASSIEKQISQLWAKSNFVSQLLKLLDAQNKSQNELLTDELNIISKYASPTVVKNISREVAASRQRINKREITAAREAVRNDPFSKRKIEKLKELEQKNGSTTMVAFLEARLVSVQKGRL